jgi:hypothetical protein
MGFDSGANQGTDSPEGSDRAPGTAGGIGAPGAGGYRPAPPLGAPPTGSWQPPSGPPPGPPAYGAPSYGAPPYGAPQPGPYPSGGGGYAPPPPPGYGPPPTGGYGAYPTGYGYAGPVAPRTDGTAIAALVLAICSFLVCPIIPAVIALAMVPGSRRTIYASGGSVSGLGLLSATKIIAWINIGLAVVGIGAIVLIALVSSSTDTTNALSHVLTG